MQLRQMRSELSRRVVRGVAILAMSVFLTVVAMALFSPGHYHFGSTVVSIRSLRNPVRGFLVSGLLWSYASPAVVAGAALVWSRARAIWLQQPLGRRVVIALLVAQVTWSANALVSFPGKISGRIHSELQLENELPADDIEQEPVAPTDLALAEAAERYADPSLDPRWRQIALPDRYRAIREASWAADRTIQAARDLPADARVLFHGGFECMILAYELYPRRVFMLPEEQATTCEEWMFGPEKKLPIHWPLSLVPPPADREKFLREHRISHDLELDQSGPTATLRMRRLK